MFTEFFPHQGFLDLRYWFLISFVFCLVIKPEVALSVDDGQNNRAREEITDRLCAFQYRPPLKFFLIDRIERETALDLLVKRREITFNMPGSGMTVFQKQENPGSDDSYNLHAGTLTYTLEEIAPNCPYLDLSREYDVQGKSRKPLPNARQWMAGRNQYVGPFKIFGV